MTPCVPMGCTRWRHITAQTLLCYLWITLLSSIYQIVCLFVGKLYVVAGVGEIWALVP